MPGSSRAKIRAVISLGTNSARLLVVERDRAGVLRERYHEAVLTRLGEGLGASGPLAPGAVERTLAVAERYAGIAREFAAPAGAIATSVLRRADDGAAFARRFERATGTPLRVLSGEEEARYSFEGATYGMPASDPVGVLDIGGGSTECAVGERAVTAAVSVEVGAVRLTERHPGLAGHDGPAAAQRAAGTAREDVRQRLAPYGRLRPRRVLAVAGTPRTIGAILFAADDRPDVIDGRDLSVAGAEAVLARLLALDIAERRVVPGMTPPRADILPAGALIYVTALVALGVDRATITRNDLLLGYLAAETG